MLIVLNKPFDVLCQFTDQAGRKTLADYVETKGVYAAGRLDRDSEGLVLLTDDGALQNRIANPRFKLEKTYWVQVEGVPSEDALQRIRQGVLLKDGLTMPAQVARMEEPSGLWPRNPPIRYRANIPSSWLRLSIREGRNRQVRRMTAAIGHPTLRLVRYAIGKVTLDSLQPGEWREVDPRLVLDQPTPDNTRPPKHRPKTGKPGKARRAPAR